MLSQVSLAHRGPRAEALHPALLTGVTSAEWLLPTPQLGRAVSVLLHLKCDFYDQNDLY